MPKEHRSSTTAGRYDVSAGSILELKAELLKQTQEYNTRKQTQTPTSRKSVAKSSVNDMMYGAGSSGQGNVKPNKLVTKETPLTADLEAWEKSRASLEKKARLYEQIQQGLLDSEQTEKYRETSLVDFDRKGWDAETQTFSNLADDLHVDNRFEPAFLAGDCGGPARNKARKSSLEALEPSAGSPKLLDKSSSLLEAAPTETPTEYVDEFGRTRQVTKSQLDQLLSEQRALVDFVERKSEKAAVASDDSEPTGPSHYDAGREVRTKGVGFFTFSQSEDTRQSQMDNLNRLRSDTVESRAKAAIAKEKRRLQLEARLERVRQRRSTQPP